MAQFQLDLTGAGGLVSNFAQETYRTSPDIHLNYQAKDNEMVSGIYNPLMKPGYLYPANNSFLSLEVPAITDEFFCSHGDQYTGLVLGNQDESIYRYDTSITVGPVTYSYSEDDGVKLEAVAVGDTGIYDIEVYQVNDVKKVFFVDGNDVGIMTTGFGSIDSSYLSTTATDGDNLRGTGLRAFLRKSDNGLLYVFDDYTIHSIDGTGTGGANGTAVMDILTFPASLFRIADAVDTRGKMYIALNEETASSDLDQDDKALDVSFNGNCGVYVWNRQSTTVSMQDYITVESCIRINRIWVGPDGNIYMMTIGTSGNNQIRVYDGGKFRVIRDLPFETKISVKDGLVVAEGMTFWAADDGYIYMAGTIESGYSVFKLAQFTTSAQASAGGAVLVYQSGAEFTSSSGYRNMRPSLVVGYRPSGANALAKRYYIYGIGTMTDANGSDGSGYISPNPHLFVPNQGDVYTGVKLLPTLSKVKTCIIRCMPTTTGSTTIATIKYYFNNSSTVGMTKTITLDQASKGYISHDINKANINSIQMEIEWDTANTMGANDFAPYLATIEYEPTTTHSPDKG
jgi:hypothetical protein